MAKHVVSTTLVVMYALLALWVFVQLVVMFRQRHKKTGYKAVFNYLTLFWALMRSTFWFTFALDVQPPDIAFYLWFWLPQSIQFLTFSLMSMFLLKLLVRERWHDEGYKAKAILALGVVALSHMIGSIILAILSSQDVARSDLYQNIQSLGSACVFFILACVLSSLGYYLASPSSSVEVARLMLFRFTPKGIAYITFAIAAVFTSRSIYNFLSFSGLSVIDIDEDDARTDAEAGM